MAACEGRNINMVKLMLDKGANPNLADKQGKSVSDYAREADQILRGNEFTKLIRLTIAGLQLQARKLIKQITMRRARAVAAKKTVAKNTMKKIAKKAAPKKK